jgi:hypothetical protein
MCAGMKRNRSSVREGLLFWTEFPMAGNYMYPEHTPLIPSTGNKLTTPSNLSQRDHPTWMSCDGPARFFTDEVAVIPPPYPIS